VTFAACALAIKINRVKTVCKNFFMMLNYEGN
jgi:hypothetical protein